MTYPDIEFDCDAYGPEGREAGALCFFAGELGKRVCPSLTMCRGRMDRERRRVFARIQELAAQGDPVGLDLAQAFTSPEQLLGGGESPRPGQEDGDG